MWVNNCIGAWNTRYFLFYLLTLTASAATMAVVSTVFLVRLVMGSDLYLETYIDDLGRSQVVDTVFLVQVINYQVIVFVSEVRFQNWKKDFSLWLSANAPD